MRSLGAISRAYCDHEQRGLRESAVAEAVGGLVELGPPENRFIASFLRLCLIVLFLGIALRTAVAGGVLGLPEPETILYGRVVTRVAGQAWLVNQGELTWTISQSIDGRGPFSFATQLESLANGRFSYRLKIPHQALAFDLEVLSDFVPLTASAWRFEHLEISVNGWAATILPPAEPSFVVEQSARASTFRVDLEVVMPTLDSDGDGLPDWWEDENGFDKWDPRDGGLSGAGAAVGEGPNGSGSGEFMTFGRWRQDHFPGASGALAEFADLDPDGDGVTNFAEYAFDANPKLSDREAVLAGRPRAEIRAGRLMLVMRLRRDAADIVYQVETSDDLRNWIAADEEFEVVLDSEALEQSADGSLCLRSRLSLETSRQCYVRVLVRLEE